MSDEKPPSAARQRFKGVYSCEAGRPASGWHLDSGDGEFVVPGEKNVSQIPFLAVQSVLDGVGVVKTADWLNAPSILLQKKIVQFD